MMKRTKFVNFEVDAIFTADWHIREDVPVCRLDDFVQAQFQKILFVKELQEKYNCPVFHAGDLFDHWKPSPWLLTKTMQVIPDQFYTVYGNHDLPQHNMQLVEKSGVRTLIEAGKVFELPVGNWLDEPTKPSIVIKGRKVLIWHIFTYSGKEPWPGCAAPGAASLLRKYPQFDVIVTGDNHKPFVVRSEHSVLINPGSLTRQTVDQIDYDPAVWLWNAETNSIREEFLPISDNVITRQHIEKKEERDERIDAFISKLDDDWQAELNFVENLRRFEKANNVPKNIMEIIYQAVDV